MDFVKIEGDLKQQAKTLKEKIQNENEWFKISLIQFFEFQKERPRRNDIAFSTISNYYKALKLFVDMNFDNPVVNWKKISKGIPLGRKSAVTDLAHGMILLSLFTVDDDGYITVGAH